MYKIVLLSLLSMPIFAGFFPNTVHTSVKSINGNTITLNSTMPKGMSGVVVHSYTNELQAISSRILRVSANKARLIDNDIINHDKLPSINTKVSVKDKVIGGYLYNNILVLAPNSKIYKNITANSRKNWIHPDLFAVYLSSNGEQKVTKANLADFAQKYQVGLIYIVRRNSAVLLDPLSGAIVGQKSMSSLPSQGQFPFYMRFQELESGWFGSKATGTYYTGMESI